MSEINQGQILLPALALVGLTFVVLLLIPYRRIRAGFNGSVTINDFELGESERVPKYTIVVNRNYMNLLEIPVLFYFACTLFYLTDAVDIKVIALAWIYVLLRLIHSMIHLSYNNVFHRLITFSASNVVLAGMWGFLVPAIFAIAKVNF